MTWAQDQRGTKGEDGWWHVDQKLLITLSEQWKIVKGLHDSLYLEEMQCLQLFSSFLQKRTLRYNNEGYSSLCPLCHSSLLPLLLAQSSNVGLSQERSEK